MQIPESFTAQIQAIADYGRDELPPLPTEAKYGYAEALIAAIHAQSDAVQSIAAAAQAIFQISLYEAIYLPDEESNMAQMILDELSHNDDEIAQQIVDTAFTLSQEKKEAVLQTNHTEVAQFLTQTVKMGDCLVWMGEGANRRRPLYSSFTQKDDPILPHTGSAARLYYTQVKGPIPANARIRRTCNTHNCILPEHYAIDIHS